MATKKDSKPIVYAVPKDGWYLRSWSADFPDHVVYTNRTTEEDISVAPVYRCGVCHKEADEGRYCRTCITWTCVDCLVGDIDYNKDDEVPECRECVYGD